MLRKKIFFALCIVVIIASLIFTGCSRVNVEEVKNKEVTENPEVRIIELKEKNPPDIASFEWDIVTEEEYIERAALIFKGTIIDKKEHVIETVVSKEFTRKNYNTVYSIKINEIYYSDDKNLKEGDTVKVMSPINSYTWEPESVKMEKNQEFILFAGMFKDSRSEKFKSLAKYYIGNPWEPIISVEEDSFKFDPLFESLSKNASVEERKISDNYSIEVLVRRDESFISDLKKLISKYKNR